MTPENIRNWINSRHRTVWDLEQVETDIRIAKAYATARELRKNFNKVIHLVRRT